VSKGSPGPFSADQGGIGRLKVEPNQAGGVRTEEREIAPISAHGELVSVDPAGRPDLVGWEGSIFRVQDESVQEAPRPVRSAKGLLCEVPPTDMFGDSAAREPCVSRLQTAQNEQCRPRS
jgi:hypothetical protein